MRARIGHAECRRPALLKAVLKGRERHFNDVGGCIYYPLQSLEMFCAGTGVPKRYTVSQHSLYCASVKHWRFDCLSVLRM